MKLKLAILSLLALTATAPVTRAANAAAEANAPTAADTKPADTNAVPAVAPAPAPTTAPAPVAAAVVATPAPAAADASATNSQHDPSSIIPLIVMDEVPLTDAIKNLARQANLNYMLDPKINYGTPDANGAVKAQPNVSLRWENLTADQALNAVLNNYNLVIIDDPKTHIARITVKDPAAPDPLVTKIIQLKYSDASNMVFNVRTVLIDKRSQVIADGRTSQLVVVATEREMVEADQLISRLDMPTKEVLIEAKLVEVSKNPTSTKGVDWTQTLQGQNVRFGNNVLGGQFNRYSTTLTQQKNLDSNAVPSVFNTITAGPNNLLPAPGFGPGLLADTAHGLNPATAFLDADGLSVVLSFLNTDADAKLLSTPRAVTLDNQEAILEVTEAFPIIKTTAGTQGSPGGSDITYTNLGTILHVTPRISANNTVNLKVIPEVSQYEKTITKTVSGLRNDADVFSIRRVETHVVIPSGNTLVMGGLLSDSSSTGNIKVPILGDIPLLGWGFRQESKSQDKRNLIVFLTPTIVQNEDFQPTQTSFLKTKPNDKANADFTAWDSGKPQDWSKLIHSKKDEPVFDDLMGNNTGTK